MVKLLKKEFMLCMHPTVPIMVLLASLVMVPNYPYSVSFFYLGLSIYFVCLQGRENHDVVYSLLLPVSKRDIVKSRMAFTVIAELSQLLLAIPFAILSQKINAGNAAGMDPNIIFFANGFFLFGIFHLVFFVRYYKNVQKIGRGFVQFSVILFLCVAAEVVCTYAVPFVRDCLDTKDPQYLAYKLVILAAAIIFYLIATWISYKKSAEYFEKQDL